MNAQASSRRNSRPVFIEQLEPRELLSSSVPALPLAGTYSGTVHLNGGRAALAGGPARRAISVNFSTSGNSGTLAGTASVDGLGNLSFNGAADGTHVTVLLTGNANVSGELSGTLTQRGHVFSGQFVENSAGRSLTGSFRVHSGGSPVSVGATNLPTAAGTRISRSSLLGTYTGTSTAASSTSNIALIITSQAADGQVAGVLSVGSDSFDMTGTIVGSRLDFLVSGSEVGDGSLTISANGGTLQGALALQTTGGIVRRQITISNTPSSSASAPIAGNLATTGSGTIVGMSQSATSIGGFTGGLTSPISGIGAPVSGTSATGTILGSPVTGNVSTPITGTLSTPVTGNISPPPTGNAATPVTGGTSPPITGTIGAGTTPITGTMPVFPGEPGTLL